MTPCPQAPGRARREAIPGIGPATIRHPDRKSTRLNSSHSQISYAVFCLKKKKSLAHLGDELLRSVDIPLRVRLEGGVVGELRERDRAEADEPRALRRSLVQHLLSVYLLG